MRRRTAIATGWLAVGAIALAGRGATDAEGPTAADEDAAVCKLDVATGSCAGERAPDGTFREIAGNPILGDGAACFFQHVFDDTLHAYYCEQTGDTWTLDYRTAELVHW